MSEESQVENCNGFRFCKDCGKLCIPLRAENEMNCMLFKCDSCGERRCVINLNIRDDQVIKKTQVLQSEAADIKNKALGEDPSMPRKILYCKYCQKEHEAVYYYKAGKEEKNIVTQFICRESGYSWTSDDLFKWNKEGTVAAPLPPDFMLEDDEYHEKEDIDEELYDEGSNNDAQRKVDREIDDAFDDDDIFGDDDNMKDDME